MTHWRKQQHKDPYFSQAKKEGYRARSVYKLQQIQQKFHVIRSGQVVVDLGAAPGSWSQWLVKQVGSKGKVIALDLQDMVPIPGVTLVKGDMTSPEVMAQVAELAGGTVHAVLSDAAPQTTGVKLRDHVLSMELTRIAFEFAQHVLIPGGTFVAKVFQGEDLPPLIHDIKMKFHPVKTHIPKATRNESWEQFIVAQGFKGNADT